MILFTGLIIMKRLKIIAVLAAFCMVTAAAAGCKKNETEEPLVLYYGQNETAVTVTLDNTDTATQAVSQGDPLGPILADRSQSGDATTPAAGETTSETSETSSETEADGAAETTETSAATAADDAGQGGDQDNGQGNATPTPITTSSHIYDNAGVIGDEGSVNAAMSSFQSQTGVSPAIFTIRDSLSGDDFRSYARDLYNTNFSDQDHVLVVYQLTPQGTWSWTCVFGTNTGTVFDQDTINTFQSDLTSAFSSSSVDSALVTTFNNAAE